MEWLVGKTGYSLLDAWTLAHVAFWIFAGSTAWAFLKGRHFLPATVIGLGAALSWEVFERFAEVRWPHLWLSPESWWNSYGSDLATVVIGVGCIWWLLDRSRA